MIETGVKRYITVQAVIEVNFPVDAKGNAMINCFMCPFLASNERTCQLTKTPVPFPKQSISPQCPFKDGIEQETEREEEK